MEYLILQLNVHCCLSLDVKVLALPYIYNTMGPEHGLKTMPFKTPRRQNNL